MHRHPFLKPVLSAVVLTAVATGLASCKTSGTSDITGSLAAAPASRSDGDWRREIDIWSERYSKSPTDPDVAMNYAQALRATGQRAQAVAVLEQATIHSPRNTALLGAYGRALADNGNFTRALEVLNRAHTPDQPDWRILSVQGAVLDQMGRHDEAQRHYASALRIMPNEPSILSNLGLSYALSKDLRRAEETLRQASEQRNADQRVRQNLALVVGLQGRLAEAETLARAGLPPEEGAANVENLRQALARRDDLKKLNAPRAASGTAPSKLAARTRDARSVGSLNGHDLDVSRSQDDDE